MKLQEQSTSSLLAELKNRDINVRNQVIKILVKRKATEAIFPLIASIDDGPYRYRVADAIANMQDSAIIPLLQLLKNPDPHIRENAAFILGRMRVVAAIKPLISLLGDSSEAVHIAAFGALGKIGEDALDEMRLAIHDPNPNVRAGIARAFGRLAESYSSTPIMTISLDDVLDDIPIEEVLTNSDDESEEDSDDDDSEDDEDWDNDNSDDDSEDDDDWDDEENDEDDESSGLPKEKRELIVADLMQLLEDKNSHVREAASSSLGMMGASSANPLIAGVTSPNPKIRNESIFALGQNLINNKIPAAIPPLIDALTDENPETRYLAVKALRYTKDTQTVQPLINCLRDPNPEIRLEAVEGLRRKKDPRISYALIGSLQDDSSPVRCTAAMALGEFGDPKARTALLQALNDEDRYVRENAARSLGMLKSESGSDIIELLQSSNPKLRCAALTTLGQTKDEKSLGMITRALKDPNADVRRKAAEALCQFSNPAVIPILLDALEDDNEIVRKYTVRALSKIKDQRVLPSLIAGLKDTHAWVRQEAAWHLWEIGDERAVPYLIDALGDPVDGVRHQAAISLGNIGGKTTETLLLDLEQKSRDSHVLEATRTALEQFYRQNQHRPRPKQKVADEEVNPRVMVYPKKKDTELYADTEEAKTPARQDVPDDADDYRECLPLKKKNPHSAREWLNLVENASKCIDREDFEAAAPLLNKAYTMYPRSEMLLSLMGFTLHNLGQYEDALKIYQYGTEINLNNDEFWANQGAILANFEQYEDALGSFDTALSLCSTDDETWCKKGIVLNNLSRFEEAITAFDMALRINPDSTDANEGKEIAQQNYIR